MRLTPYDPDFEEQMEAAKAIMKKRRNALRKLAKGGRRTKVDRGLGGARRS
jgi:hypothetical protein